jgi:hypothetical protein
VQHPSTFDDRLLAFEVETALKALGIAAGGNERTETDLRLAVEDLRGAASIVVAPDGRDDLTPTLLPDDEIFGLR